MKKKKMPSMFQPATQIADGTYESSQSTIVFTTGVICVPHTYQTSTWSAISQGASPYWKTYISHLTKSSGICLSMDKILTHVKER